MTRAHILLVEDDAQIRTVLSTALQAEGYSVASATSCAGALQAAAEQPPDLIILDLGLPDGDGLAIIGRLRSRPDQEILVISAREQERDRVRALDDGADDFLAKPFSQSELLARVSGAMRRFGAAGTGNDLLALEDCGLNIDVTSHQASLRGRRLHLTPIEFSLLTLLARQRGRICTHEHLLRNAWGDGAESNRHYLRIYLSGLRRKLEDDPANPRILITIPGVGYRLGGEAAA